MIKWLLSVIIFSVTLISYADLDCSKAKYKNPPVQKECRHVNQLSQNAQQQYQTDFFNDQLNRMSQAGVAPTSSVTNAATNSNNATTNNNTNQSNNNSDNSQDNNTNSNTTDNNDNTNNNSSNQNNNSNNNPNSVKYY